jgi:sugar phosphate isomerase/epimerase
MSPPLGISEFTTNPLTLEEDLALYREAGVPFMEVCEVKLDAHNPHPQLCQIRESGLTVSSVQPRLHGLFPELVNAKPKAPAERMARLKRSIELFGQYFPDATLVTISGVAPEADFELAYRTAEREYAEVARIAEDHGVRVALEPLHPVLMNVGSFICTIRQAGRIVEAVNHPAFGIFLDVWHFWDDPHAIQQIQRYGPKIFGVHISDWKTPRAFADRHIPGTGEIPLVPLLRAIKATGYNGAYTLEVFSETRLPGSLWVDPRHTVFAGVAAFGRIWKELEAVSAG